MPVIHIPNRPIGSIMKNNRNLKLIHSRSKLAQVFFDLADRLEQDAERARAEGLPQKVRALRTKYQIPSGNDQGSDPESA